MSHACNTGTQAVESLIFYEYAINKAVGGESTILINAIKASLEDYLIPISRENIPINKFSRLKDQWKEETSFLSSIHDIVLQSEYQQIIGMGEVALPLILNEMRKDPYHWFWALRSITGEDPVKEDHRGKMYEMTSDWLEWGIARGII